MDESYVYLIGVDGSNHVKFGYSKHPDQRLKQLQTGSSQSLSLLKTVAYSAKRAKLMERKIHQCFSCYRMIGEWFELDHDAAKDLFDWAVIRYENDPDTLLRG